MTGLETALGHSPGKHYAAAPGDEILTPIQLKSDWRSLHWRACSRVPQGLAVDSVQRQDVSCRISCEGKSRVGCQYTCARSALTYFMAPADFARLIVDGFDDTLAHKP